MEQIIVVTDKHMESAFVTFNLDTRDAVTTFLLYIADNRPEQHRLSKGYMTAS